LNLPQNQIPSRTPLHCFGHRKLVYYHRR
jgi:hypothetical protein